MKPSRKITSDKQMQSIFKLQGNTLRSLKSWSCIAVEKSNVSDFKFGHLFDNSWRTSAVINSIGNSMYCSAWENRCPIKSKNWSRFLTWRPWYSGRRKTDFHNFEFWLKVRHRRQTFEQRINSAWVRYENIDSRIFSGNVLKSRYS